MDFILEQYRNSPVMLCLFLSYLIISYTRNICVLVDQGYTRYLPPGWVTGVLSVILLCTDMWVTWSLLAYGVIVMAVRQKQNLSKLKKKP